MSAKLLNLVAPSALAMLLMACGVALRMIHSVQDAPINVSSPTYDLSDVTKAIRRAGAELGWEMQEEVPGHIVGTFIKGKHAAFVDITYTREEYSINYRSSRYLDYRGDRIHRNYNAWVRYLSVAIDANLITL